jgi:transcriptional regulator with XRE-family HTH domain
MSTIERGNWGFGTLLREWRDRRRMSQLELALSADVSARHISFLETGRARPSRGMILRLTDVLDTPLANRNDLLEAAGFVAAYSRAPLDDVALAPARNALTRVMHNQMPYPALLFTRHWDVVDANETGKLMFGDPTPGTNAIDLFLTDAALRARIVNLAETLRGVIARLSSESRQIGGDPRLDAMVERLTGDPAVVALADEDVAGPARPFLPVRIRSEAGELSLLTATAELGTAQAIALRDLHLELFFPADETTERYFEALGRGHSSA